MKIKRIKINTKSPYEVVVGDGILESELRYTLELLDGKKFCIISDFGVPNNIVEKVKSALYHNKNEVFCYSFPCGEESKSLTTLFEILSFLADCNLSRKDTVVAVGGGVVGDVAGLASSLYMRGIKYVQVPTTLLSAIDSSVGGKTAVNLPKGKNLVGSFYQPTRVICDVSTFSSLEKREVLCGLAEGVKCALIEGEKFFSTLEDLVYVDDENTIKHAKNGSFEGFDFTSFVGECVRIKGEIVSIDEFENGERKILNFGHSVGHAIEKLYGYKISHGECVAKGICKVLDAFAVEYKNLELAQKVKNLFVRLGVDISCPFTSNEIVNAMANDKKANNGSISLIVMPSLGNPKILDIELENLREIL